MKPDVATSRAIGELSPGTIVLAFKAVYDELRFFRQLVEAKLSPESVNIFEQLDAALLQIAAGDTTSRIWCTPTSRELETTTNDGRHQREHAGHGRSLNGALSFKWEVAPLGNATPRAPLNRYFALRNSSIVVRLVDAAWGEVVRWRFDIGAHDSPGCHFHVQFTEGDEDRRELLRDLDVPRFPTPIFMPTDAIEFLLGELWQEEWARAAASGSNEMNAWRRYPRSRLRNLLKWQLWTVQKATGSPWAQLKSAKPDANLLWDEEWSPSH
jgi:hypothetical protein